MKPHVSVVMGVRDDAPYLRETLDSVLSQAGPRLEVIVVDDGSTDGSREILRRYAETDARVRVVEQANQGLTIALIRGCAMAGADYVARQDAADLSRPGRMAAQAAALDADPSLAFVSCWTDVCGPEWEFLHTRRGTGRAARPVDAVGTRDGRAVLVDDPTHHGSVMFRKRAYDRVGGYRAEFYLAQDRDLWCRLAEEGRLQVLPRPLYAVRVLPDSRTSTHREVQLRLGRLALEALDLRRRGRGDQPALEQARSLRPEAAPDDRSRAAAFYFVGEALRRNGDPRCIPYLRRALRLDSGSGRAWARLAQAGLGRGLARLRGSWRS
ncbi:MAG TPA: glycosyltransferase [Gemmatimonadota bacterium]|jgi:glycosyltransferase involved in cell wall biosynthesis